MCGEITKHSGERMGMLKNNGKIRKEVRPSQGEVLRAGGKIARGCNGKSSRKMKKALGKSNMSPWKSNMSPWKSNMSPWKSILSHGKSIMLQRLSMHMEPACAWSQQ